MSRFIAVCFFTFFVGLNNNLFAQESSVQITSDVISGENNILLFPFEDQMYLSDGSDKAIIEKEKLSQIEFTEKLRLEFDKCLLKAIANSGKQGLDLTGFSGEEFKNDLDRARNKMEYQYVNLNDSKKSKQTKTQKNDGQLRTNRDDSPKYMSMSADLNNKDLMTELTSLSKKYKSDLHIFINQFEFKYETADASEMTYENYKRQICVHYTVMDKSFHSISGGIAKADGIPKDMLELDKIEKNYFPKLCHQIINSIPK